LKERITVEKKEKKSQSLWNWFSRSYY